MPSVNHKHKKILVIGAGLSGLAAAQKLSQAGLHVTILEARNRIGGRTYTQHHLGMPFDMGASWIHGLQGNVIADLAISLKLPFKETNFENFLFLDRNNVPMIEKDEKIFHSQYQQLLENAGNYARAAKLDMSLADAVKQTLPLTNSSAQWQDYYEGRLSGLRLYTGANVTQLSAREWDQEEILPGSNFILQSGYEPIVNYLAKDLTIELNSIVHKIIYDDKQVIVQTQNKQWQADAVIITLPLSILKNNHVIFDPPLPQVKQQSLHKLGMGLVNRVAIKFPQVFWPQDLHGFFILNHYRFPFYINYDYYFQQPILLAMYGGTEGYSIEKLSDAEIIEGVLNALKGYFGTKIQKPIAYAISRWGLDPFSLGAYSYIPVHATGKDLETLAEPVGNTLFFAGEATHRKHPATTHGAYFSGLREANRILDLY